MVGKHFDHADRGHHAAHTNPRSARTVHLAYLPTSSRNVRTVYRARSQDVAQDMEQREQSSAQASADLCALYYISCAISCDRARYISGYDRYGIQTALEVKSDLGIELSDLDNLCSHVSLASKPLHEPNETGKPNVIH